MSRLSGQQKKFVEQLMLHHDAALAAREAGYRHARAGARLLQNNQIQEALSKAAEKEAALAAPGQQYVQELLREVVERCLGRIPGPDGVYCFNPSAAVKALQLLGKHLGMFPGKSENSPGEGAGGNANGQEVPQAIQELIDEIMGQS